MLRLTMLGSLCLIALAAGCGSSVDHDSAVKVMNSALTGTIAADGQVVHVDWTGSNGNVDVTLTNTLGTGTAHVVGTVTRNGNTTTESIDVTFTQWHDNIHNVTLDGTLHEAGTFSAPLPLSGDVTVTGAVAASGSVNATVDFDLHGSYSPTGFAVKGDVGGNVLNASFNVSAP
jgi:hypothetical protein